jgi:lipoprotein signal peptidase
MSERSYRLLLWTLALTGLILDQASKYAVFSWLQSKSGPSTYPLVVFSKDGNGGALGFQLSTRFEPAPDGSLVPHVNKGALFGWLSNHQNLANGGFAVVSLLAAVAIAYWSFQKATVRDPWLCAALGLILAGTLGNLYDRVVFDGVRDFLHWNYLFDWPVFNFADCCLVCGAFLLLIQAFGTQPGPAGPEPARPEVSALPGVHPRAGVQAAPKA